MATTNNVVHACTYPVLQKIQVYKNSKSEEHAVKTCLNVQTSLVLISNQPVCVCCVKPYKTFWTVITRVRLCTSVNNGMTLHKSICCKRLPTVITQTWSTVAVRVQNSFYRSKYGFTSQYASGPAGGPSIHLLYRNALDIQSKHTASQLHVDLCVS